MVAQPLLEFLAGELALRLDDGPLAVRPSGLDRVEPRASAWQAADQEAAAAVRLTSRLCPLTQACTSRLTCQEALSQISAKTRTPSAASRSATQARKAQVSGLIGRPSTKRSSIRSRAQAATGRSRPAPSAQDRRDRRDACQGAAARPRVQACSAGCARRENQTSSWKPSAQPGRLCACRISRSRRRFYARSQDRGW